jgi:hypothetical protein
LFGGNPSGTRGKEQYVNGHREDGEAFYARANENAARAVAYFGPYLFWGTVGVIVGGIVMLA